MDDDVIRQMAQQDFDTLASELPEGTLPDFASAYENVLNYYRSLPWH